MSRCPARKKPSRAAPCGNRSSSVRKNWRGTRIEAASELSLLVLHFGELRIDDVAVVRLLRTAATCAAAGAGAGGTRTRTTRCAGRRLLLRVHLLAKLL